MGEPDVPVGTARPRGPSPARTARTREGIVAAALDIFLEQGFEGTRMIDVAQRAGVAKGTLYLHFTDKEALFEGVLRQVIEAPLAGLAGLTRADGEPLRAFLSRVGRLMLEDMESSRRGPVIRLVVAEAARFPALAAMYRRMVIEPATAAIARARARGAGGGRAARRRARALPAAAGGAGRARHLVERPLRPGRAVGRRGDVRRPSRHDRHGRAVPASRRPRRDGPRRVRLTLPGPVRGQAEEPAARACAVRSQATTSAALRSGGNTG